MNKAQNTKKEKELRKIKELEDKYNEPGNHN